MTGVTNRARFSLILLGVLGFLLVNGARGASERETQAFLRDHHHAWLPYPLPAETSTNELARLLQYNFDTIGLSFAGSYHGGQIDFSKLDTAIGVAAEKKRTVVLSLTPRFDASDGVVDRLSDGTLITNVPYKNPNASMIDIFDPAQRAKFCDWIGLCARRYGADPRVAGFVIGWGYMGETGFFIGDYLTNMNQAGSVASGYSDAALKEFNRWRGEKRLPLLAKLPLPSLAGPDRDYILFHQFRSEFAGNIFQKEAVAAAQARTSKPVGTFGYISVSADNYARNWGPTPNADFYRSAVSAASYDLGRTLLDSGAGWEDSELHDGPWNYTVARLERDLARQIAHGAVVHAMPIRIYETERQWETNFFPCLASFLLTQDISKRVRPRKPTIALFQPTWAASALPIRSAANPFRPRPDATLRGAKFVGLVESFGLPYQLITERDLLAPATLKKYKHVIVPLWDLMPIILGADAYGKLAKDPHIVPISSGTKPMLRSEFRELLRQYKIPTGLDFDSDRILAGRVNNLVFNWNDQPITVTFPEGIQTETLPPMGYRFVKP